MSNQTVNMTPTGLSIISGHKTMSNGINSNEWQSFSAAEGMSNIANTDMEQLLHGNSNEENWGSGSRNHFSMPNPSFLERAERQQKRELHTDGVGLQQQPQQQLTQQQQQELQQQHIRQQQLYQLQQQQLLRMQLEIASQTQLPQSPGPSMTYHHHPPYMSHPYVSGLSQFPTGHSPANSPLSPGNYAGDDYFSSRQVSPGPAASPGGSSKIKSRPRPSTAGARVSQGGIKALFGQSLPKGNRTSLDLKSENALQHLNIGAKTPSVKKKASKNVSADNSTISNSNLSSGGGPIPITVTESHADTPACDNTPTMTLAERRAAAASTGSGTTTGATGTNQQRPALSSSKSSSLIPPNLGLDSQTKRIILPPNITPGSELGPLTSPALLSTSVSSPAPIQIDRIIPRNSSSQARTEEQQRQLDAAMERVNFEDVTVAELKEMLRQRGKHGGGKKADLIKRLQAEIELIRANRNASLSRSNGGPSSTPVPIHSPGPSLHRTLGNLHIGSPPIHSHALHPTSPSGHRYTPYSAPLPSPGLTSNTSVAVNNVNSDVGAIVSPAPPSSSMDTPTKNTALSGVRDSGSAPIITGPPGMSSMLGSSYLSSDVQIHSTLAHSHNNSNNNNNNHSNAHNHQQATPTNGTSTLSANVPSSSTHTSPTGNNSLRSSYSPESYTTDNSDFMVDQENRQNDVMLTGAGKAEEADQFMSSDDVALCNEFLAAPGLLAMQGGDDESIMSDSNPNGFSDQQQSNMFGFQPLMNPSLTITGDGTDSSNINQVKDGFLAFPPPTMTGNEMNLHQQQSQQQQQQQQQTTFNFDSNFSTEGEMDSTLHHQSLSQDDLDMLLLGSQESMTFEPSDSTYSKDGFMW
ncbi:hypothetical protein BCR41DRAFT_344025 [Lobosporangium transversale]|uniref:SAP domain-containing protein n=1 Tax=Lobosporangium transversale TaxID=64571 RepID=A0A1Y2H2K0_9FUNG|nr:hypothetical protein BCR41DRAFT_344025 [Lobosporangium transversale]ORZ28765.1 hypothetical protein BCR41DRAFT_344025 [Lobosporangium transversale]|eukprot:XP_021886438.1 hypothetical protein BCR41DRAFT_344025 [Lobosporangium transversale]